MAYEDLIKHLRCPDDRGELDHYGQVVLACKKCGKAYPVRDGIPVMLVDEEVQAEGARALEKAKAETPEPAPPDDASDSDADE
jgi:hypothetical protein